MEWRGPSLWGLAQTAQLGEGSTDLSPRKRGASSLLICPQGPRPREKGGLGGVFGVSMSWVS